ncbi:MAG: hypothetical protein HYR96_02215 [Deltaproteobacteria bacterium]|nr:hypothetical protein [Deltaproteobacteria bacterium]
MYSRIMQSIGFVALLLIMGCTGPKLPKLAEDQRSVLASIRLRGRIDASVVREVVRALNFKGHFPGLKDWSAQAPDDRLNAWGGFVTDHWYRDADAGGLVTVLDTQPSDLFRRWENRVDEWKVAEGSGSLLSFWRSMVTDPDAPIWVGLFSPALSLIVEQTFHDHPTEPLAPEKAFLLTQELHAFLETHKDELSPWLATLARSQAVPAAMRAASQLEARRGREVWGEVATHTASLVSQGDLLMLSELLGLLDRPSSGFFSRLGKAISRGSAPRRLLDQFLARRIRAVGESAVRDSLARSPLTRVEWLAIANGSDPGFSQAYRHLFTSIQTGLKVVTPKTSEGPQEVQFERLTALHMNALALTEWMQTIAAANAESLKALPESEYQNSLLKRPLKIPDWELAISVFVDGTWRLDPVIGKKLEALRLAEYSQELSAAILGGQFAGLSYALAGSPSLATITNALTGAIESVDLSKPLALTDSAAGVFLELIGSDESTFPIKVSTLETPNLLVLTLSWFRDQTNFEMAQRALRSLLLDSGIGSLSERDIEFVQSIFSGTEWHDWVGKVLERLPVLLKVGGFRAEGDSRTVEWLYSALQGLSNEDLSLLVSAVSKTSEWQILSPIRFPTFVELLAYPERLRFGFQRLAQLGRAARVEPMRSLLGFLANPSVSEALVRSLVRVSFRTGEFRRASIFSFGSIRPGNSTQFWLFW